MSSARCKVLLCLFAVTWILVLQSTKAARNDRQCRDLLRRLLRNPPNNIKIAINIGLSKARYICHEGFKLVGKEVRTCKGGKWRENVEPTCLKPCGKPEDIPHSKVVGSSFNFNDQLRYECIKGYTLTGPRLRTCGNDGKWSEAPRCEETISCGQSFVNARAKIVGGTISQRGMWPWQIAIYRINKNVPQFSCGGVLVSRQWVLTAAHCFYDAWGVFIGNANLYLIKAGDHNLSVNETLQQQVVPKRIFVHPIFKPSGLPFFDGDIALIKLNQEVELSKFVRTVCLPEKSEGDLAIPKTRGTVAGWGVRRPLRRGEFAHLSEISKVLRHVSFPIQSDQLCRNKSGIQFNTTTAFCAGDGRGGEDACQGDSGGAFVRELGNSKWVVIGVVSWGNGCAQKDQYGYYTRIYPFLDWIKETMNEKKEPANNKPANQCSSQSTKQQRRRGINLNEDCGLDLVFLFDASVRVNKFYFQTSLEFAKELLTVIGASKRSARTQVAAVTEAKLEFNLGDSKADTIDKAIKAIDNIMYVGWISSYIRPFKLVRNKVAPNSRNDSHQVMMFITDGLDLSGSVQREAKYLRDNKHFEVYAIGIGRKVKTRALISIASANEEHNHVISVREYRNLQEAVGRVVHMGIGRSDLASCQSPGGIAHGKKFGSDYSHNKTVRYECDAEYTLEGKNKLTCNDGKWNYNPPQCKAPCSNPGSPANGTMRANNFRHNSWVTFACDRHHQRDGKERIKCNDGSWSGSVPVCIAMCPDPGVPSQGMRVGDNFQDGKTVTFECKKNYDLLGNSTIRCNGGVWNSEIPKCKGRCDYSGTPNNGHTTNGNFRRGELLSHGSKVEYACGFSYTLTGSKILHCDDGTWNGSLPSCKASCNDPGSIAQARKIGNDYSHRQIVTYECVTQGYSLVGNPTLTCNDGSWDSQLPQCKVRSQCGADLRTESGVITSPRFPSSYPDEANCEWKIAVDNGSRITLTFVMFEVEGGNKCKYDYLEVSNGETRDSANQVAKLCGTELPKPITSSGPHLFLKFRSDSSMAFKGFKLRFTKTVLNNCGATLSTLSGEIKSPNYPQHYQPNRNCTWKISVPSGNHIQLAFKEINIEDGETGKCVYDYVEVYSGIGKRAESLGRYCGKQSVKLATSAHTMTVTFHSDNTINSKGFKAMFAAVCGAQLQASNTKRQFISHPSYGDDNYEPNLHCVWQLTARSGYKIHLRLKEFDVEMEKNCGYDYVIIRDGNNSTAPLLGRVYGKGRPVEFVTRGNRMWIEFRTDLTTNKKGFIAEYWTSLKTDK